MTTTPTATLTLFGYESINDKIWAFARMGLARRDLGKIDGLRFWKMLGSGDGGGFSLNPNWARYGFFAVWDNESDADNFFRESAFMRKNLRRAAEIWTVKLAPIKAVGKWSGTNPFLPPSEKNENQAIAVLTRATINLNKLNRFWRHVPATSREINAAQGLIASIGVGEAPFINQATFSFWENEAAMREFAYKSPFHREVIKKTRQENWYKEEMFARFNILSSEGNWNGRNPLEKICPV